MAAETNVTRRNELALLCHMLLLTSASGWSACDVRLISCSPLRKPVTDSDVGIRVVDSGPLRASVQVWNSCSNCTSIDVGRVKIIETVAARWEEVALALHWPPRVQYQYDSYSRDGTL